MVEAGSQHEFLGKSGGPIIKVGNQHELFGKSGRPARTDGPGRGQHHQKDSLARDLVLVTLVHKF